MDGDEDVVLAIAAKEEELQRRRHALRNDQREASEALEEERQHVECGGIEEREEKPLLARRQSDSVAAGLFGASPSRDERLEKTEKRSENGEEREGDGGRRREEEGAKEMEKGGESSQSERWSNATISGERADRKLGKGFERGVQSAGDFGQSVLQRGESA